MPLRFSRSTILNSVAVSCSESDEVGSSITRILAFLESALAISTICIAPELSSSTRAFGSIASPRSVRISRARRTASRSLSRKPARGSRCRKMFCATVSVGTRLNSWKIMAMPAASASAGVANSRAVPSRSSVPASRW